MSENADIDDHSSDVHGDVHDSHKEYESHPRGIEQVQVQSDDQGDAMEGFKISPVEKEEISPILESSRGPSISTTAEVSDTASTQSLPVVQVSQPETLNLEGSAPSLGQVPPPSPSRSAMSSRDGQDELRNRHRSTLEVCSFLLTQCLLSQFRSRFVPQIGCRDSSPISCIDAILYYNLAHLAVLSAKISRRLRWAKNQMPGLVAHRLLLVVR